jgi:hypothetical protein
MRKVFEAADPVEAGLLRGFLEDEGIACVLRNEQVAQAIPTTAFFPELWVERDEDHPRAVELIAAWTRHSQEGARGWTCLGCGESVEATFDSCWSCGRERVTTGE